MIGLKIYNSMLPSFLDFYQNKQLHVSGNFYLQTSCQAYTYMKKHINIAELFPASIFYWIIHAHDIDELILFADIWEKDSATFIHGVILHSGIFIQEGQQIFQSLILKLLQIGVKIYIENEESDDSIKIERLLYSLENVKFCYDIAHDLLFGTNITQSPYIMSRIELIHLHGIKNAIIFRTIN